MNEQLLADLHQTFLLIYGCCINMLLHVLQHAARLPSFPFSLSLLMFYSKHQAIQKCLIHITNMLRMPIIMWFRFQPLLLACCMLQMVISPSISIDSFAVFAMHF